MKIPLAFAAFSTVWVINLRAVKVLRPKVPLKKGALESLDTQSRG